MIKVKTMEEAWTKVNEIFPTDYAKDNDSSERAGYPIYRSTAEGHYYDYICDLNNRLEINLAEGNQTINIWIIAEEQGEDVEVTVVAKSGETRVYATYAEFKKKSSVSSYQAAIATRITKHITKRLFKACARLTKMI